VRGGSARRLRAELSLRCDRRVSAQRLILMLLSSGSFFVDARNFDTGNDNDSLIVDV
jgi:hypothetical protein